MIALVLVGAVWAYSRFGQNYRPRNAGDPTSITVDRSGNRNAELEYMRSMRESLLGTSEYVVVTSTEFLRRARTGKFPEPSAFEQRYHEVLRTLRDNLSEVNMRQVPERFVPGHLKLGLAHRHCYEACVIIRRAYYEEADVQKKSYDEAALLLKKAWGEVKEGQRDIRANIR